MVVKINKDILNAREEYYAENMLKLKDIPEYHLEVLREHDRYNKARGVAVNSRRTALVQLIHLCRHVKKPLKELTRRDLEDYLIEASKTLSPYSIEGRKARLKVFFRWLYGIEGKDYPDVVKWMTSSKKNSKKVFPEHLLTREEVIQLANASGSLRNKAMILVLYESACRVSELCTVRIKDVEFDEYGALMKVDGKTGERKIRLIETTPILKEWINQHPYNKEPEAPLFYSVANRSFGSNLFRYSIYNMVRFTAKRIGIKKRVWVHLLRHSRLTELAKKGYTESFLKKFAGWSGSSLMPQVYISLSGKDIDDVMLEKEGIRKVEAKKEENLSVKCKRCGEENSVTNRFCGKCATALDEKSQEEIEYMKKWMDFIRDHKLEIREMMSKEKIKV